MTDRQVHVVFTVDAATDDDARKAVSARLDESPRRAPGEAQVRGWMVDEELVPEVWWRFGDTPILQLVGEMFPPEPHPDQFHLTDGGLDRDGFEDAHEQWRDECLSLAVGAAGLPALRERLERAERVRDGMRDVMERHLLQPRPDPVQFPRLSDGRFDEEGYRKVEAAWEQETLTTLLMQQEALEALVDSGGNRTAYLPAQFHQEWIPADLLAVTTLRELLEQPVSVTGRLLGREQRDQLAAMLFSADPEVSIPDPDMPLGMPIYEGPASEAHQWLVPGVYPATGMDGQGEFRVVVGRSPVGDTVTASAAFPPAEHDSLVLGEIARILEGVAGIDREEDDPIPTVADLRTAMERIDTLIACTGRAAGGGETLLERGALLSELLAEREKRVEPGPDAVSRPRDGDGPDLSR